MDRPLLIRCALLALLLTAAPVWGEGEPPAVEEPPLVDLATARANSRGNELVREGKFEEAVEAYHEEALKRPENGILQRNLAGALARAGRGDESLAAYSQALRFAETNREKAKVLYDLGNTLVVAQQPEQAMQLWAQAMVLDPTDMDLKHNFEFLLKQQQQGDGKDEGEGEQEQQQEQQENGEQNEQEQQNEEQQEQEQQPGQEQEEQQAEQQEEQPQPSEEDEMSEEDAQRLLDAMLEEEKELQAERMKQQSTDKKNVEKDW